MGPMQEMPVFESRVQVDPKVKDHWGIPVARLSGHRHRNDLLGTNFMSAKAEAWLKEAGAATVIRSGPISLDGPSGGQHQAGTCRMGNDSKTSVVDKYCRVHDVDNVYVIDGSVHVTNGGFNPVLTIMAIAYYASDNLLKTWRGDAWPIVKTRPGGHACTAARSWRFRLMRGSLPRYLFAILLLPGASLYYSYSGGKSCTKCHEIWQPYRDWHESAHRNIACSECHGDVLTLDAGFHLKNIRQLAAHIRGKIPEQVRLKTDDVLKIEKRCAKCHRQEYAAWSSGLHSATYSRIFLNKEHNQKTLLMDDCLRCHSMHFEGSIRELVTPVDRQGPWKLLDSKLADQPAIPCLTCHQMHRHGDPLSRPPATNPMMPACTRKSLALTRPV